MKKIFKILIISLLSTSTYAQQAAELDPKFVKLPRYNDINAITTAITVPKPGMLVYNIQTKSNWYYNGVNWLDMTAGGVVAPLSLSSNSATTISGTTSATGEGGIKGVTTNDIVGFGVWGLALSIAPTATTYGVYGQNNSINANGVGVGGIHNGTGWGGYFGGTNALKTFGKTYLDGAVSISNANFLEFGKGLTKQEDNGKIAYNAFGEANTLSIVGGGIANDGSDRKIKMWANGGTIFNGGASFDKSVNIGNFDLEPIAKLQVSSSATSEAPSIAIIDTAPDNQNGGILQFRNQKGLHRFDIQGLFGLQSLPIDSYLSFNKNGSPLMRLRGDGKLGLGVINPSEKIDLVGNIKLDGEIKPNGVSGTAGQVLSNNGDGTMKWENVGSIFGQIIEVSPWLADTAALRTGGYKLIGDKTQTVNKAGKQIGQVQFHPSANRPFHHTGEVFFSLTLNKLFIVTGGTGISTFDLNEATYGDSQFYATGNYDLTNTKVLFTGSKILVYPYFIFDCATGATTPFPTNTCPGITVTKSQVWTGTRLILYGPTGGFTFNPTTNTYTCIETTNGNLYHPGCSVTWTGNLVVFYGGYITVSANKVSLDGGLTYNPATNIWSDIPVGGPRVHNHNAIWTGTDVLITGGQLDNSTSFNNNQSNIYNPVSFAWNSGYTPNSNNFYSIETTKSIISNNKIFYFGVTNDNGSLSVKKLHSKYFNIPTKTWVSFTTSYSHKNENVSVVPVAISNAILYFGRTDPTDRCEVGVAFGYLLETSSSPEIIPAWNVNIFTDSPKVNNNKYVLAFGNFGAGWLYNADNNKWKKTNLTNLPSNRRDHFYKPIEGTTKFLIWGGLNGSTFVQNGAIYNASSDTWTPISVSNAPTENLQGAIGNGKVLFWGTSSGKIYDIATNVWTTVSTSNAPTVVGTIASFGNKFIHSSANGIKNYLPATNSWIDEPMININGGGTKVGKYLFNQRKTLNTETNEVKLTDYTDFITPDFMYLYKPHDDISFLKLNSEFPSEIMNLETGVISYARVKLSPNDLGKNNEVLRISPTKLLLFGDVVTEIGCFPELASEAIQFVNNSESNIIVPLNLKTNVYKKK